MGTNNFAELTGRPAKVDENEYTKTFAIVTDDGKREYKGSCHRYFAIPTLDDVEYNGKPINGRHVQHLINTADESEQLFFGNSYYGFYMRHGNVYSTVAPFNPNAEHRYEPQPHSS